jgi:PPP family 3-phenylpropionic acid transporter
MDLRYPTSAIPSKSAACFYAAYFAVLGLVLPFLGPYLHFRGVSAVGIGLITAAFSLAKLVYTPFVGLAVDRGLWFRGVLSCHVVASLLGSGAMALASSPLSIGTAVLLVGVGYGTVLPLVETAVLESLPQRGYGRLRLWGSIGFVAVAMAAGWALGGVGLDAFPALLAMVLVALSLSCLPFERRARPQGLSTTVGGLSREVWWLLWILTAHQVSHGPYYAFYSVYLREAGYTGVATSVLWSLGVGAELVAFVAGKALERRLGLKGLMTVALVLTPVRWFILALSRSPGWLVLAQVGHAATFAGAHLAGVQLIQKTASARSARLAQALYSGMSFGLGVVAGSALSGPLYGWRGGGFAFAMAAVCSAFVLALWTAFTWRQHRRASA